MSRFVGIVEFIKTVQAGSFTDAATDLGVSKSHISKKVSQLENRLCTRLFQRSTRTLRLTEEGYRYYDHCTKLFYELEDVEAELTQTHDIPQGVLKISAPVTLGEFFISSLLADYTHQYPDVIIDFDLSTRRIDIIEEGFDLAIRIGHMEDSSLIARRLADFDYCVTASPEYIHKYGRPQNIDDLKSHNCLICSPHGPLNGSVWKFSNDDSGDGVGNIRVKGNWCCNNCYALISAARKGLGLIWLPSVLVSEDLSAGSLITVLDAYSLPSTIWAVYPAKKYVPAKVEKFIRYLQNAFNPNQPYGEGDLSCNTHLVQYKVSANISP